LFPPRRVAGFPVRDENTYAVGTKYCGKWLIEN
jgi:hypothetical protein